MWKLYDGHYFYKIEKMQDLHRQNIITTFMCPLLLGFEFPAIFSVRKKGGSKSRAHVHGSFLNIQSNIWWSLYYC